MKEKDQAAREKARGIRRDRFRKFMLGDADRRVQDLRAPQMEVHA